MQMTMHQPQKRSDRNRAVRVHERQCTAQRYESGRIRRPCHCAQYSSGRGKGPEVLTLEMLLRSEQD